MAKPCFDHLDFCGKKCPGCGLIVDSYGNTEDQYDYCSFPDCGCDGERLCMAKNGASTRACAENVEGMLLGNKPEHKAARAALMSSVYKDEKGGRNG